MRIERTTVGGNGKRPAVRALAVLLTAACLITTLFCGAALATGEGSEPPAETTFLTHDYSLTVNTNFANSDTNPVAALMTSDLEDAGLVFDVYKIADAVKVEGQETYSFDFAEAYAAVGEGIIPPTDPTVIEGEDTSGAYWDAKAQEIAKIVLDGSEREHATGSVNGDALALEGGAGLYLVVTRSEALGNDHTTTVTRDAAEGSEAEENIVSRGETAEWEYTFLPQLVSLPTKGSLRTAQDGGDWQYAADLTLKPEREHRMAEIQIAKTLQRYVAGDAATFVFQIEADYTKNDANEHVYSGVYAFQFDGAETQTSEAIEIPAGADVTVTEVYSGSRYTLVAPASGVVTLSDIQVSGNGSAANTAAFTNTFDISEPGSGNSGSGITNTFTFTSDDAGEHWAWNDPAPAR